MPQPPEVPERSRSRVDEILDDVPPATGGLYVDRGVGGTVVYTIVGADGTKLCECRAAQSVADEPLLSVLRSWAVPHIQPALAPAQDDS